LHQTAPRKTLQFPDFWFLHLSLWKYLQRHFCAKCKNLDLRPAHVPLPNPELTGLDLLQSRHSDRISISRIERSANAFAPPASGLCPVSLGQNKTFHLFKEVPRSTQWDCGISISSSWACLSCRASDSRVFGFYGNSYKACGSTCFLFSCTQRK
jgi:hypothetical protein